jgi:hypothetical protein
LPALFIFGFILAFIFAFNHKSEINKFLPVKTINFLKPQTRQSVPFKKDERISFDVFLLGIKSGQTDIIFRGETKLGEKDVYLIESNSDALNYKGRELIYVNREDFLPLRVERDLVFMGSKENIIEDYNAEDNSVIIKKTVGQDIKTTKIEKEDDIQNSISLIYLCRTLNNFDRDILIDVNLPTREFKLRVKKDQKVAVPMGSFDSFLFEDEGSNFRIWSGKDKNRLPLRFDFNSGLKRYSMRLSKFFDD